MHTKIRLLIVVVLFSFTLFSQDIGPKRNAIVQKLNQNDFESIFVNELEGPNFVMFYEEQMMAALIKRDFKTFLDVIEDAKSMILISAKKDGNFISENYFDLLIESGYNIAHNFKDDLTAVLKVKLEQEKQHIRNALHREELEQSEIDFIEFYLVHWDYIWNKPNDQRQQMDLHFMAQRYNTNYPQSKQNRFVQNMHGVYKEPSWYGWEVNINLAINQNSRDLKTNLSGIFSLGGDFRFYLHSSFFGLQFNIENYELKNNITTSNLINLSTGDSIMSANYSIIAGRQFVLNHYFRLSPFIGYTFRNQHYKETTPEGVFPNASKSNGFTAGFDLYIQFKKHFTRETLLSKQHRKLSTSSNYMRLGTHYNNAPFSNLSQSLNGNNTQFVLGFGCFIRRTKREIVNTNQFN